MVEHREAPHACRMSCQLNLALCYVKLGKNDDAISTCTDALKVDPDSLKATYRRGQAYQAKVRYQLRKINN